MQILDVYTGKEYDCYVCKKSKVYYAKIADNEGKLVTKDGKPPNGKFGRETNVLTTMVDVTVKDRIHHCVEAKTLEEYQRLTGEEPPKAENKPVQVNVKWNEKSYDDLSNDIKELYHKFHDINALAYHLTKEQHPKLNDQDNVFGQIVHAKSLVLTNLMIVEGLKKLNPNN